ncbi:FMN-binding protein [Miniphocaeibacter massiliensis]|uniref:FMN-binding protein n=1 Tax=Miniphocaeibacter massiliensis TaxID=2041841 RepID=UPI000C06F72E|nr:FMN-binding protein [Miniphocaeibacter massiliensis]
MKKKNTYTILILIILVLLFTSCGNNTYKAGNYEAVGKGRNGDIRVSVLINSKGKIEDIELLECLDNEEFVKASFDKIKEDIISKNSSKVDAVSGATSTSKGIIEAVNNAIKQAE